MSIRCSVQPGGPLRAGGSPPPAEEIRGGRELLQAGVRDQPEVWEVLVQSRDPLRVERRLQTGPGKIQGGGRGGPTPGQGAVSPPPIHPETINHAVALRCKESHFPEFAYGLFAEVRITSPSANLQLLVLPTCSSTSVQIAGTSHDYLEDIFQDKKCLWL